MRYDCKSTDGCHFDKWPEYAVDMFSMKSCLENAKIVTEQSEMVEQSASHRQIFKGKEMFTLFGDMVERLQENELGQIWQMRRQHSTTVYELNQSGVSNTGLMCWHTY